MTDLSKLAPIAPDVAEALRAEGRAEERRRSSDYIERCRDLMEDKGWLVGKSLREDIEALPCRSEVNDRVSVAPEVVQAIEARVRRQALEEAARVVIEWDGADPYDTADAIRALAQEESDHD
jgi:hypothetical protein